MFALFFVSMGLWALASAFGIGQPPQQPTQAAARFTEALTKTGFIDPLLGASFIVGGLAMLRTRTTPLGLVVLAPAVAVILFFHLWLSGQYVWGPFVAAYFLLLCWRYRSGLAPLWNYRDARAREAEQSCPLGPLSAAFEQSRYIRAR